MSINKTVIIPLANDDFDPTEVAIPWQLLKAQGITVKFASQNGQQANADPMMLSGIGLDPWGFIPLLNKIRLIGLMLRAESDARKAYQQLLQDPEFQNPLRYDQLATADFDALWLPGGHAPKMRDYLEDKTLQQFVADFFDTPSEQDPQQHKPIAAVCHGVLVCARATSTKTGKSPLYGKKTTALTWKLESTAWLLTKFFCRFWDSNYYRTYQEAKDDPKGHWGVEAEVKRALQSEDDFLDVDKNADNFLLKTLGMVRDKANNDKPAWVVQHDNYLSGRWPGDVYTLTQRFINLL